MKKDRIKQLLLVLFLCLTLGLAPFSPEPHLFGKLRWVWGGAKGMQLMDWFDLFLHGAPWLVLAYLIIRDIASNYKKNKS